MASLRRPFNGLSNDVRPFNGLSNDVMTGLIEKLPPDKFLQLIQTNKWLNGFAAPFCENDDHVCKNGRKEDLIWEGKGNERCISCGSVIRRIIRRGLKAAEAYRELIKAVVDNDGPNKIDIGMEAHYVKIEMFKRWGLHKDIIELKEKYDRALEQLQKTVTRAHDDDVHDVYKRCLLYTSPSPRDS